MYKCKYCGKEFETKEQLGGHIVHCVMNPNHNQYEETIRIGKSKNGKKLHICKCNKCGKEYEVVCTDKAFNTGKYKKFCSLKCANSRTHSEETKNKISGSVSKFMSKNVLLKVSYCENCGKEINPYYFTQKGQRRKNHYCCDNCRKKDVSKKISNSYITTNRNYSIGGTYAKHGWYKGFYCDSSWELAFVIYHLEHNIDIKRCKLRLIYTYKEKEHLYFPDFEINGKVYEIKGWETEKDREKKKQYPDIIVLYKKDMKKYLDYVIEKYGKDFVTLYEKN